MEKRILRATARATYLSIVIEYAAVTEHIPLSLKGTELVAQKLPAAGDIVGIGRGKNGERQREDERKVGEDGRVSFPGCEGRLS